MKGLFGERLIQKDKITDEQLQKALERQRMQGGRLGHNLVALGYISEDDLTEFFRVHPEVPETVEETGLDFSFIVDLVAKHALNLGEFTIPVLGDRIKLPNPLLDQAIERLRKDQMVEVRGADQLAKLSYRFALTDAGIKRASGLLDVCRYMGPAPVPFEKYRSMVEIQTIKSILVDEESINDAFSHIIVSDRILERLGPAISSGKEIFLYGPSGNGKTTIAETIGRVLPGSIYMPYAVQVEGEIVTIFDQANHVAVESEQHGDKVDQRWILVKRPVVMVGGEMNLNSLNIDFNPISKFYEAPLQMKANNGLFIVDDFGRQLVDPQVLLNRWIVPLERRTDFITFHTGMKIEIPFDQLVVFSTNLEPRNLVDEAFLRRIRYKINIDHPELHEYREIFQRVCESNSIAFNGDVFDYLIERFYHQKNVKLNSCHCRDLIESIIDDAHYHGIKPEMTKRSISLAWESYFVEM
jgi:energy-coupling factor transporter ATP-binding protein EcfA2